MSKELKKPVLLMAQANREAVKNRKKGESPELHDLAESDGVGQNATRVLSLSVIDGTLKISVKKNRYGINNKEVLMIWEVNTGYLKPLLSENPEDSTELAKVLEVPPTTVNGWMRGAHLPDIEKLMEICDYLEMPVGEMLGDHRHINDLDEVKHLMDVSLKQKAYIENLEAELNECKMLNNQLMSDLDADEGLAEICVNEFIADTIKAVKDAGVKKITVEF